MERTKDYFSKCFCTFTCMCRNIFGKIIFCALHVFLCACILRPVCARTRAQLRGNIAGYLHVFPLTHCIYPSPSSCSGELFDQMKYLFKKKRLYILAPSSGNGQLSHQHNIQLTSEKKRNFCIYPSSSSCNTQ